MQLRLMLQPPRRRGAWTSSSRALGVAAVPSANGSSRVLNRRSTIWTCTSVNKTEKKHCASSSPSTAKGSRHDDEENPRRCRRLGATAGVSASTTALEGDRPYDALLARATDWDAELIVVGRSDLRRPGQPYIGSQTEHLFEFTTIPVVVVPHSNEVSLP
jgi:nucleotide-binding universal stress UspA family protein